MISPALPLPHPSRERAETLPNPRGFWATLSPETQREFLRDYESTAPLSPAPKPVVFKAAVQREEPVPKPPKGHAALRDRKELLRVLRMYGPEITYVAKAIHCDSRDLRAAIKRLAPELTKASNRNATP